MSWFNCSSSCAEAVDFSDVVEQAVNTNSGRRIKNFLKIGNRRYFKSYLYIKIPSDPSVKWRKNPDKVQINFITFMFYRLYRA